MYLGFRSCCRMIQGAKDLGIASSLFLAHLTTFLSWFCLLPIVFLNRCSVFPESLASWYLYFIFTFVIMALYIILSAITTVIPNLLHIDWISRLSLKVEGSLDDLTNNSSTFIITKLGLVNNAKVFCQPEP